MLVFKDKPPAPPPTPHALLFLLPAVIGILLAGATISYFLNGRRRKESKSTTEETTHLLTDDEEDVKEEQEQERDISPLLQMLIEGVKLVLATGLFGVSIAKLVCDGVGRDHWENALDVELVVAALVVALLSLLIIVHHRATSSARLAQALLVAALFVVLIVTDVVPFFKHIHPKVTLPYDLGFAQTATTTFLAFVLLATPPHWKARFDGAQAHPAQLASPLSRLFFSFLEPGMIKYYRKRNDDDVNFRSYVPALPDYLHSTWILNFRWRGDEQALYDDQRKQPTGGSWGFVKVFRWDLLITFTFASVWVALTFVSPLAMSFLLNYVQNKQDTEMSPFVFVAGIFLGPLLASIAYQASVYRLSQTGLRLRSLLGHAVYGKVLRTKAGGGGSEKDKDGKEQEETLGKVNNLIGTDIDTITNSLNTSLYLWAVPPKLVVTLVFLYYLLGWSAFVALGAVIVITPVSTLASRRYGSIQGDIMKATDKRITVVNELLSSIRTIKMFAWEPSAKDKISDAREKELTGITRRAKIYSVMMLLSTGIPLTVTLSTFASYVFIQKGTLTASRAFTSVTLFGMLREAVISATYLLTNVTRARVSLGRINEFITDTEELDSHPREFEGDSILVEDAKFRWSRFGSTGFELVLDKLEIPMGKTTIVAGEVGSGKTMLLLALMGELTKREGSVKWPARTATSYASQAPWLQDGSVKANVLFGEEEDEERYRQTIFACALESDIAGFPEGDQTRVGEKGLSMSGGQKARIALARAVYASAPIVLLDDILSAVDSHTAAHIVEYCLNGPLLEGRTVILVTHFVQMCTSKLTGCELVVKLQKGRIDSQGPPGRSSGSLTPTSQSMRKTPSTMSLSGNGEDGVKNELNDMMDNKEEVDSSGQISLQVWREYLSSMGGWIFWLSYAVVNLTAHLFMMSQGWWISHWVNAGDRDDRSAFYFGIYSGIQLAGALSLTAMYLWLIIGGVSASRKIHSRLTNRIFGAPFRFFDVTSHGQLLNRFSKDMEIVDTEQIEQLQPLCDYSVQVAFVIIIISSILPVFILPASIISAVFAFLGKLYVTNALAARREVASARSPLFSTLGDTTNGVTVIRAFQRQEQFETTYLKQTDRYNQMQLYETGLDRWLELRSDMVSAAVALVVGILALRANLSSGTTGFLVSTGLEFTSRILLVVRAINKNELSLNSVHRIFAFSSIEQEEEDTSKGDPPASWPEGEIEFDNYSAKYSEDGPDVLHDLSFKIKVGEKIGVVGPSGCGKSSLSLALLRFILPSGDGTVTIDGRPLSDTNLTALRSRTTLVPQDPTLFSGTLRSNLDPNDEYDDADLWKAVRRSGFAKEGDESVSLDTRVQSGGSNFSQGQRQLLSLARALVRSSKILILDEATASLDNESDRLMQKVVREEFVGCTNITIAHRLESVIDFDKILVLEKGHVVEFDSPRKLLENEESHFRKLCEATGNLEELKKAAK